MRKFHSSWRLPPTSEEVGFRSFSTQKGTFR